MGLLFDNKSLGLENCRDNAFSVRFLVFPTEAEGTDVFRVSVVLGFHNRQTTEYGGNTSKKETDLS